MGQHELNPLRLFLCFENSLISLLHSEQVLSKFNQLFTHETVISRISLGHTINLFSSRSNGLDDLTVSRMDHVNRETILVHTESQAIEAPLGW